MAAHSNYGPSQTARWKTCTASVEFIKQFPERESTYAIEGTEAHDWADKLNAGALDERTFKRKVSDEMYKAVMHYVNYCAALKEESAWWFSEQRLGYGEYVPGAFGTVDFTAYDQVHKRLHVVDLKYGKGVRVFPQENEQMLTYGLAALLEYEMLYDFNEVVLHIVQPRVKSGVNSWGCNASRLREWGEELKAAYEETIDPKRARFRPSEKACQFCPARARCRSRLTYFLRKVYYNEPINKPVSNDELVALYLSFPMLKSVMYHVESELRNEVFEGNERRLAVVRGKGRRGLIKGTDEAIHEKLGDEALRTVPKTLTQLEKEFGKEAVAEFVTMSEGKTELVVSSDSRAVKDASDEFKDN